MLKSNHLDVFGYVLEVVLAVLHGDLVVVLALGDVSHLGLGLVLQQQDGGRHQHAQDHLDTETHSCGWTQLDLPSEAFELRSDLIKEMPNTLPPPIFGPKK